MKKRNLLLLVAWLLLLPLTLCAHPTRAVHRLLDRIGGKGTAERFVVRIDPTLAENGEETFLISAEKGKPCIQGSSTLAVTTGINWYLNHYAHVNLSWNQLTADLTHRPLPLPQQTEKRSCSADYRYYLNYCTFSYSMSTWTWERWQQEIDWMALHGINMPLQIVGLDVVWQKLLTKDLNYSEEEANRFIAGPCFQAWWGMNNLEGWGGPNPKWWYERQEQLAKKIVKRQRELGMQPVLPGYSGMIPSDITAHTGYPANGQGKWCMFVRPYILDPNTDAFTHIAACYYRRLKEVMGTSEYYSMDPFHEGANTQGIDVPSAYTRIAQAMTDARPDAKWVIQFWQWSRAQYHVLDQVEKGKLIILDLFSDAHSHFQDYKGHEAVYCALPNFGGRTGLFGRLSKTIESYYEHRKKFDLIKGIGATPEAIEQTPVVYDALFELPWRDTAPDAGQWLEEYTVSRYGTAHPKAQKAWELIRNAALNCQTGLQGPHEAVLCARPALQVGSVSSWGGADIFYNPQHVIHAAHLLLQAHDRLRGKNYDYDLTDFTRQALTDYGHDLLQAIKQAYDAGDATAYGQRRNAFLQLILDLDRLLCTNENFMLGRWTQMARNIADEAERTTEADRNWLELDNARTLITTWGQRDNSETGGLRDYSYRQWGGMMKDFYFQRWKQFFEALDNQKTMPDWFDHDWNWAHDTTLSYPTRPTGNTAQTATELLAKYFVPCTTTSGTYYLYRHIETSPEPALPLTALRGQTFRFPLDTLPEGISARLSIDFNNDFAYQQGETAEGTTLSVPTDALPGAAQALLTLSDGTQLKARITLKDDIRTPREVSVRSNSLQQGTASLLEGHQQRVCNQKEVTLVARPVSGYDFSHWSNQKGQTVSSRNPYTYYGAAADCFTAHFSINRWGTPQEDLSELNVIREYGQFLTTLQAADDGKSFQDIYQTAQCPTSLCHTTQAVRVTPGSKWTLQWKGKGGLNYCRLTAYIDLNADGDFDDEGEMLGVVGEKESAGNHRLNAYTLPVLLPYAVPDGTTHLRLRFDGAWSTQQLNEAGGVPAKASCNRMVYDIPVRVDRQYRKSCTVTVKSEDPAKGVVDANGQPDTYTYAAGEEVVLRCYPAQGYRLDFWTDAYGRKVPADWTDGNFLRFHAPEHGTYTAHFKSVR